ncbi:Peptidyl-prolyl cis-trans isomerase CWC27 like protein [Eufriesea mexicana]|uniref:Peptidyl-prolyl cis-trans isomerase CWC27 like protein n=1 Tax=Eufriesea mexicana TaxID=516756 RepID=A0A310SC44_9HYME|nr:Peptidyl-prolyl cis-trans isomerase CWC27 like protein [Eufriesea mexicana]
MVIPQVQEKVVKYMENHLNSTPDFQHKHTIFGNVTGETLYNMLKLEEVLAHENGRPLYPPRFLKTIILNNLFSDIIPRIISQESEEVKYNSKTKTAAVKDFNILSFGEEAKEDEEESVILNKKFTGTGKSVHDHLTDPKLSSQSAVEPSGPPNKKRKKDCNSDWGSGDESDGAEVYNEKRQIRVKAVRRGNAHYVELRNRKGVAYISTEKDVWHEHTDIRIIEEMENEHMDIMKTTAGDDELELWSKETPKACRNFIQLCTGEGGKIYGEPFEDEFHTRLQFCRRDLIGMVNAGMLTMVPNTSLFLVLQQIFRISIQPLVELLENLHIIDKPHYPPRLIKSTILNNAFSDIIPRIIVQECEEVKDSSKTKTAVVKDFNLLLFGGEAEEDEEESVILNKKFSGKGKSVHVHLTDPK